MIFLQFLDFDNLPDTNFSCVGKVIGGYYADLETNCQMFHVCTIGQLDEPMDIRFLCLNGTVFDQETRVCERIDEVDCSKSEQFYSLNLELYGNTQPSLVEENADTDPPIIIKASTTTTTTTTTQKPKTKSTRPPFYTTSAPTATTVTKVISSHHFPISGGSDIRFNPEEINISLNPAAPPNIRSKTVAYQQQVFSDSNDSNKKVVVTTHTSYGTPEKEDFRRVVPHTQRPQVVSTQKVKSQPPATPADINYGFTYHQTENTNQDYHTEQPQHNYQYHHQLLTYRHAQFRNQFKTTTYRSEHNPTTRKHIYNHKEPTTYRTPYVSSVKTPSYHGYSRTEKPQRLQLPLPLLPTLPPLTFSSPAPFSLGHHIETKRYTNEHQPPPRIVISASASVSDNSGRRLNYSLGTIGVAPLLEEPPKSYDDYKDHDVVLDPFYHDVPKIKTKRRKRQTKPPDVSEQAAVDVLKFLFDWYASHQKSSTLKVPIEADVITQINDQLAPIVEAPTVDNSKDKSDKSGDPSLDFSNSALFNRKSKFNIVGDVLSVTEKEKEVEKNLNTKPVTPTKLGTEDYIDDNYEAIAHQEKNNLKETDKQEKRDDKEVTTKKEESTTKKEVVTTKKEEPTTPTEEPTTVETTTTTTEPTTTSRIMGILRSRAIAHQKRIRNENQKRYTQFLASIKPKIRRINRGKKNSDTETTEQITTSFTSTVDSLTSSTTTKPSTRSRNKGRKSKRLSTTERVSTSARSFKRKGKKRKSTESPTTDKITISSELPTDNLKSMVTTIAASTASSFKELDVTTIVPDFADQHTEFSDDYEENLETTTLILEGNKNFQHLDSNDTVDIEDNDRSHSEEQVRILPAPQYEPTTLKEESQIVEETQDKPTSTKESIFEKNEGVSDVAHEVRLDENTETYFEEPSTIVDETLRQNEPTTIKELAETEHAQLDVDVVETTSEVEDDDITPQADLITSTLNQEIVTSEISTTTEVTPQSETTTLENIPGITEVIEEQKVKAKRRGRTKFHNREKRLEATSVKTIDEPKSVNEENKEELADSIREDVLVKPEIEERDKPKMRKRGRSRFHNYQESSDAAVLEEITTTKSVDGDDVTPTPEITEVTEEPLEITSTKVETIDEPKNASEEAETTEHENTENTENNEDVLSQPEIHQYDDTENDEDVLLQPEIPEYDDNLISTTESATVLTESAHVSSEDDEEHPTEDVEEEITNPPVDYSTISDRTETVTEEMAPEYTLTTVPTTEETTTPMTVSTTEAEITVTNLTPAETTTTETSRRRTRPPRPRISSSYRRPNPRHRFSTDLTSRPSRRKPAIEEDIIDALTHQLTTTESLTREEIYSTSPKIPTSTIVDNLDDISATDAPLFKSANPTQAESSKESLHTTPLSMAYKLHVKKEKLRSYIFNCFDKAINKFYSDPRDCRLFHYCTSGYTKNQLLDMKFVCDLGTYFDDEKLICTKTKPERCL